MLDIQSSPGTPKYAFDTRDEVIVNGVSYRPQARRDWGYIFSRTDATGVAESFDNGKIAQLVQKGLLTHFRGAFLPEEVRKRDLQNSTIISAVTGRVAEGMKFRSAFVEAFLELEAKDAIKRTDSAVIRATYALQNRAAKIMGSAEEGQGQTGKHILLPKAPCPSALLRWVRNYQKDGLVGLCDGKARSGNRNRQIGVDELALMSRIIDGYADPSQPTQKAIFDRIEAAFEEKNRERALAGSALLVMPSRETVRQEIKRLDPYQTYLARHGEEAARKKFAPVGNGVQVTRPLERVEIDEWTIDLVALCAQIGLLNHLSDEEKKTLGLHKKKARWILTVAICARTRCIVAMRLSRTASKNSAVQTLEMITRDKGVWTDTFGARSPWNMFGTPELVVSDNGSGFLSFEMRAAMQDLGIRTDRPPAGIPEMRARIERVFRTMSTSLMPLLTGRTFSDVVTKGDANPEDRAALTPDELSEALVRWVVDVYHNSPHEGLDGETPANCWNRLVAEFGVQPPPDMRRRRLVFGTHLTRTLSKKGIRVLGNFYHSEELARWMLRSHNRQLAVRWYHQDIGAIGVQLGDVWVEVPAVMDELRGVSSAVWYHAVRTLRATYQKEAAVARSVVLQAIRDIQAMNEAAMKREGVIVQDWSAENLQKIEDRLLIGFDVCDDEPVPDAGESWGTELPLPFDMVGEASAEEIVSVDEQPNKFTDEKPATEDFGGDADAWTNESK